MKTSDLVGNIAALIIGYFAIKMTSTLVKALVAYFAGITILNIILRAALGNHELNISEGGSITISVMTGLIVAVMFYQKYKLSGGLLSFLFPVIVILGLGFGLAAIIKVFF